MATGILMIFTVKYSNIYIIWGEVMEAEEKALAVFKFVDAYINLSEKKITDITNEVWYKFLKDIPKYEGVIVNYQEKGENYSKESDCLLSIQRQEFVKPPQPAQCFAEWLAPDWDNYYQEAAYLTTLSNSLTQEDDNAENNIDLTSAEPEKFEDSQERVEKYNLWLVKRNIWAKKERKKATVNKLYASFRELISEINDNNKLELIFADGLLVATGNDSATGELVKVNYPLLLKKAVISFDAKHNQVEVKKSEVEEVVEFCLDVFEGREFNKFSREEVKKYEVIARNEELDPWDEEATEKFLKIFVNSVCLDGRGQYINDDNDEVIKSNFIVFKKPVLFLRRKKLGAKAVVKDIIDDIKNHELQDGAVRDLFSDEIFAEIEPHERSIEELLAATSGDSLAILLAKKANKEQLEIAERVERSNGVLVQGPPGTGKTHTIANLMGHFIAQGKTVLVTSEKDKALNVIKEKLPVDIQKLCVTLMSGNNKDMEHAIDGILEYTGTHHQFEEKKRMSNIQDERKSILGQLSDARKKIYAARLKSHKAYVYNGEGFSARDVGKFLAKNAELDYIPGRVKAEAPLPLSMKEFDELYSINGELDLEEATILQSGLPEPELIVKPAIFENYLQRKKECVEELERAVQSVGGNLAVKFDLERDLLTFTDNEFSFNISAPQGEFTEQLNEEINCIKGLKGLEARLLIDSIKGQTYHSLWEKLFKDITETYQCADVYRTSSFGQTIAIDWEKITPTEAEAATNKIKDIFAAGGKVTSFKLLFNSILKKGYQAITINNASLVSVEQCNIILEYLRLLALREKLELEWNQQVVCCGGKAFTDLDSEYPEYVCYEIISKCSCFLDWYEQKYSLITDLIRKCGLNPEYFCDIVGLPNDEEILEIVHNFTGVLPIYLRAIRIYIDLREAYVAKEESIKVLSTEAQGDNIICNLLFEALLKDDLTSYTDVYNTYYEIYNKYSFYNRQNELLRKLKPYAPGWARAIAKREDIHGKNTKPEALLEAWKFKQFELFYEEISDDNIASLQVKIAAMSKTLERLTVNLVCTSAWYYLLKKFEQDKKMASSLEGWKQTRAKMGKTKSARNADLRMQCQKLMLDCQKAVPAWVMNVNDALSNFNLKDNKFDVIIIDEASQSDLTALPLLYMGKKVIVVGDDKQVSPLAVGVKDADVQMLAITYLKEFYPTMYQLFDARYSLYNFANLNYKPLMLREHFRCVPSIIGYCNNLCYDGKILPLREAASTPILPAMVNYRVKDGKRDGKKKINLKECENIVALYLACVEQPEYKGKTFGAVSLLGMDQVKQLQQILYYRVEGEIIEKTKMMVGDSSSFQGDERDVIFASMVDSNDDEAPLRKKGDGQFDAYIKRYNVAVSRAKDQLWVVNSLDYQNCLKADDLRRGLLDYMENPLGNLEKMNNVEKEAESEFEKLVGKALLARGFDIVQQYAVGSYRIDLIIRDTNIAIECDGEAYHSGDNQIRADMERQAILERLGWRFLRIRGSAFFRREEECMNEVEKQLDEMGAPRYVANEDKDTTASILTDSTELLERVKLRAAQIIEDWHDNGNAFFEEEIVFQKNADTKKDKAREIIVKTQSVSADKTKSAKEKKSKALDIFAAEIKNKEKKFENDILKNVEEFKAIGEVIDKTLISNLFLVIAPKSAADKLKQIADRYNLKCTFEPRGTLATNGRPSWIITKK